MATATALGRVDVMQALRVVEAHGHIPKLAGPDRGGAHPSDGRAVRQWGWGLAVEGHAQGERESAADLKLADGVAGTGVSVRVRVSIWVRVGVRMRVSIWVRVSVRMRVSIWVRVSVRMRVSACKGQGECVHGLKWVRWG